ncbi:MAG: ABC transporter substrate-binding protein [Syntrophales bacterium]
MILLFTMAAYAGVPTDTVQANVNKVLDVLRDPKLKGESAKEIKKKKLRVIYEQMFNDVELGKRTLARNWNSLSVAQRQEFVILFRQVLEKAYIDRILAYTNEKIVYERETMISGNLAEVQTKVIMASKEIPITYKVILKDGSWKVYDVNVENVSLVLNYRTQFSDILAKNKPEQLLEILRKKVKGQ